MAILITITKNTWGGGIDGLQVYAASKIKKTDYIIISVKWYFEIYNQLIGLGIDKKRILPFWSLSVIYNSTFRKVIDIKKWAKAVYEFYVRLRKQYGNIKSIKSWFKDKGDETLRYLYDLNEESLVFDLGGYKGEFTEKIADKYGSNIMVFEPVPEYARRIKEKFSENTKISVFDFGLEDKNSKEIIYMNGAGSSVYKESENGITTEIEFKSVSDFLNENNIKNIDLMKINIEGGEYALLEHLIRTGEIMLIDNLQIQFHNIASLNARKRQKKIWKALRKTHKLKWAYRPFVWESWERK